MVAYVPYGRNGKTVPVSPFVNCPSYLLPDRDGWPHLAEALESIDDADIRDDCIVTIDELTHTTPLTVISNTSRERVFWAIYRGHKAARPMHSPFIDLQRSWPTTSSLTLDFQGGRLVQVMPGDEEVPPLPWMTTAGRYEGGIAACEHYWREHSILWSRNNTYPNSRMFKAPSWWLKAA